MVAYALSRSKGTGAPDDDEPVVVKRSRTDGSDAARDAQQMLSEMAAVLRRYGFQI